jgi:hypothetical protein
MVNLTSSHLSLLCAGIAEGHHHACPIPLFVLCTECYISGTTVPSVSEFLQLAQLIKDSPMFVCTVVW